MRENCTSGSEGRAEAAAHSRHLPRPDSGSCDSEDQRGRRSASRCGAREQHKPHTRVSGQARRRPRSPTSVTRPRLRPTSRRTKRKFSVRGHSRARGGHELDSWLAPRAVACAAAVLCARCLLRPAPASSRPPSDDSFPLEAAASPRRGSRVPTRTPALGRSHVRHAAIAFNPPHSKSARSHRRRWTRPPACRGTSASPRLRSSQSAGPDERVRVEARVQVDPHGLVRSSHLLCRPGGHAEAASA